MGLERWMRKETGRTVAIRRPAPALVLGGISMATYRQVPGAGYRVPGLGQSGTRTLVPGTPWIRHRNCEREYLAWVPVMLPEREQDTFDDWYDTPIVYDCPEPRLEMRRARADEFDAVWDMIDLSFATKRPRAMFDWLYRRNPCGLARCYVGAERSTGRVIGTKTDWPWPAAQGPRALRAVLGGDSAVVPDWRGRRAGTLLTRFRRAHPWCADMTRIGWPNEASRHIIQRDGRGDELAGWLRHAVLPISPANLLARHRVPRAMATAIGRAWDTLLGVRQRRWTRAPSGMTACEIQRFDSAFDTVTARAVAWPGSGARIGPSSSTGVTSLTRSTATRHGRLWWVTSRWDTRWSAPTDAPRC